MNKLVLVSVGVCCVLGLTSATQAGGAGGQANGLKPMGFPGMKKDGMGFPGMKKDGMGFPGIKKDGMGLPGMKKDGMGFPGMMNKGNKVEQGNFNTPQNAGQKDFGKNPAGKDEARKKNFGKAKKNNGDDTEDKESNGDSPSKEGKSTRARK